MQNMPTQAKSAKIVEFTDKLNRATVAILVQTQGLRVKDMNELRAKMRAAGVEFQVAKNTLLRIASERNKMTELDTKIFNGQTAIAFGYDDEVAAAKVINDYVATSKVVVLKSGIIGGKALSATQVENLAKLPGGKKQVKAQVVGTITSPASSLVGLFNAPLRDLAYVLQARADQLQPSAE
jgi:large subunit ribosomal protein L10